MSGYLGSRIGIYITHTLPCDVPFISHFKVDRNTSIATDRSLEGPFVFYRVEFIFICCDYNTEKTVKPSTCPASITFTPTPRRRRKPQNTWALPWIMQREERDCYRTLLDELITTDIPGYRNFTRMEPAFFDLIEERITPHLRKSIINFRKPLKARLKLAFTLRHLSTRENYTLLQYHWRVGRTTICKFVPQVC